MKMYASDLRIGDKFDLIELLNRMHLSCGPETRAIAERGPLEIKETQYNYQTVWQTDVRIRVLGDGFDLRLVNEWLVEVERW